MQGTAGLTETTHARMRVVVTLAALAFTHAVDEPTFTGSSQFERWSHFKNVGLPGVLPSNVSVGNVSRQTAGSPLGQAAIADATCRMLGDPFDGYVFWRQPEKAQPVLDALKGSPSTDEPSHFTLTAQAALEPVCKAAAVGSVPLAPQTNFNVTDVAGAVQNWYHALCAPSTSPSWHGKYDPGE